MKCMTTKEVADFLGITVQSVNAKGKEMFPDKGSTKGRATEWTEEEVTAMLESMKERPSNNLKIELSNLQATSTALTPAYQSKKYLSTIDFGSIIDNPEQYRAVQDTIAALNAGLVAALERKVASQQVALDTALDWATIKRMEALNEGEKFEWRPLKKWCEKHGYDMPYVNDVNYGRVRSYHKDAWDAVYGELIDCAPWIKD